MEEGISQTVQAFLAEHIQSYEELEILLLLRSKPGPSSIQDVAQKLGVTPQVAAPALEELQARKLLTMSGEGPARTFSYEPASEELRQTVDGLAKAYVDSRLEIVRLMTKNAIQRVRNQAIHTFADAFVVGKGKKDG